MSMIFLCIRKSVSKASSLLEMAYHIHAICKYVNSYLFTIPFETFIQMLVFRDLSANVLKLCKYE